MNVCLHFSKNTCKNQLKFESVLPVKAKLKRSLDVKLKLPNRRYLCKKYKSNID